LAKEELAGVGQIPSLLEQMDVAIHYRRCLTDEEMAMLTPEWCAIPAIDEAGYGKQLEVNS
jgi:hypothetical protein